MLRLVNSYLLMPLVYPTRFPLCEHALVSASAGGRHGDLCRRTRSYPAGSRPQAVDLYSIVVPGGCAALSSTNIRTICPEIRVIFRNANFRTVISTVWAQVRKIRS